MGNDVVRWSAALSDTRARAAIAARRYGVPPTMIEAATRRRSVGDWRGACAAADVDVHLNPDSVRRWHGAAVAERLSADLRTLAPDLLRWHLPRHGHGGGRLVEGLLIPLADYGDGLTLVAATPCFALAAGQRIVLTVLPSGLRRRGGSGDPALRALLDGVRLRSAERYCLRRHRMFWDAAHAADLSELCTEAPPITELQDVGEASAAWAAAGIELICGGTDAGEQRSLERWLATLPVNLPGLAARIHRALPGAEQAVIKSGGGAIMLGGLDRADGRILAEVVPRPGKHLPVVPAAAWARPVDADLLRFNLLRPHELHPLVADALAPHTADARPEPDDLVQASSSGSVLVRCGSDLHRVARIDGRWQTVDHDEAPARELLLARLGGSPNPCRQAAQYLGTGRHVVDPIEGMLEHGRADEVLHLLREHAGASALPDDIALPDGGTLGEALSVLRENTLQLRMILAGAVVPQDARSTRSMPIPRGRRSRKGELARTHR